MAVGYGCVCVQLGFTVGRVLLLSFSIKGGQARGRAGNTFISLVFFVHIRNRITFPASKQAISAFSIVAAAEKSDGIKMCFFPEYTGAN